MAYEDLVGPPPVVPPELTGAVEGDGLVGDEAIAALLRKAVVKKIYLDMSNVSGGSGSAGEVVPENLSPDLVYDATIKKENQPSPLTEAVVRPMVPALETVAPSPGTITSDDPVAALQSLVAKPLQEIKEPNKPVLGDISSNSGTITSPEMPAIGTPVEQGNGGLLSKSSVPSVPISQSNLDMSQFSADQLVQPQPPAPPKLDLLSEVVQQLRQGASGALGNTTALPANLAAALTSAVAVPARAAGYEGPANLVGTLQNEARRMQEGADFATGANPEPSTPGQKLARTIGRNASPSAPFTVAMTGADLLSQAITSTPATGAAPMDKATAQRLLTPPGQVTNTYGPRVTHTVKTAGGPASVSDGDLRVMGGIGAVTLGAIFAPSVIARISKNALPSFRPVANAASGTEAMSNRIDLARTYDDVNAGIFRVARRAGLDPMVLQEVQDTFRIQTGGSARNLVNSAVINGEMQTPTFVFKTPVSVSQLAKADTEAFRDYLHARDTFDDISKAEQILQNKGKNAVAQQAAIGPIEIRGMTKPDALSLINNLEAANPELKDLGKSYRDNVREMRKFNSTGEYSTISRKEAKRLNQESQNYVPWRDETGKNRVTGEAVDRLSPFDALKDEMQASMRSRMENEANGLYIDKMAAIQPNMFVKISTEELTANPNWKRNTVEFYRRGKLERYTTDPFIADVLNHDPYAVSGTVAQGLYASKRLMESTATGVLAPWFSVTSALRSYQIGKITTGDGLKPPSIIGMTRAVPQQLYPQVAKAISESLNNGSGGWLESVLGRPTMDAMSRRLANAYDTSFYAQLEKVGTHKGSFLEHQQEFNAVLDKVAGLTTGSAKSFINGYKAFLNSIHNSPSFDFAQKNVSHMALPKLAAEARHLTGDPLVQGQFMVNGKRAIRMDKPLLGSEIAGKAATIGTQGYGFLTGVGREAVPWWNITTQGMKRIGESYVNNPAKFVGKTYLYQMTPAAALFMYSRGAGLDPNGKSYSDYQMNQRSEYAKLMNWYIPIPGRPAEDGIEVPRFHELAPAAHMMEVALDHMVRSSVFSKGEDFMRAALSMVGAKDAFPENNAGAIFGPGEDTKAVGGSFGEAALVPPTPPLANAVMATQGMVMPQGIFGGGDAYKKKQDPYDQLGGMNATVELVTRALGTGLADVLGSGYAAYTQTPEGVLAGVKNAMTEGGKRAIMKTPIARDMFDVKPPQSGNTRITEELFKKEKAINNLSKFYRTWDKAHGDINTKMASERGGTVVDQLLGSGPPSKSAGLDQPAPTNPMYIAFMEEVYNKMNKDSPDKKVNPDTGNKASGKNAVWVPDEEGGIGMKSLWRRYGDYSTHLKRLRSINDGNNVTWQLQLSQRPEQLKYLQENNIDPKNLRSVRNFYETKRQDVARQILFSIRAVEEDFSKRLGKKFQIEDLDPYAKGGTTAGQQESVINQPTQIAPWNDGSGVNQ